MYPFLVSKLVKCSPKYPPSAAAHYLLLFLSTPGLDDETMLLLDDKEISIEGKGNTGDNIQEIIAKHQIICSIVTTV